MQSSSSYNCMSHNIKILNIFNPKLQLINTKTIIKNKLKELLSELKRFYIQSILVLKCKKNDHKIIYSRAKLIDSGSDIDDLFKFRDQSIMTKMKIIELP